MPNFRQISPKVQKLPKLIQLLKAKCVNLSLKDEVWSVKDIGGGDRIREMTTRFYAHVFEDAELRKFIFEGDGAAAHGQGGDSIENILA